MEKGDTLSFGAAARRLVDETDASAAAPFEDGIEIVDDEADVMDAGPALGDELADRRVISAGFEQLHERVAGGETGNARTVSVGERHVGHAEDVAEEGKELVEMAHGDADMCDTCPAVWAMGGGGVGHEE